MAICFYIFFSSLILLYTVAYDLSGFVKKLDGRAEIDDLRELHEAGSRTLRGIFRCTVLGILMAICMKGQSSYLTSTGENITIWLVSDVSSALQGRSNLDVEIGYRMPTHYSSLLVVVSTCVVFAVAFFRVGVRGLHRSTLRKMSIVIALLVASYLTIGAFPGFSLLLGLSVLSAFYGLLNPEFGKLQATNVGAKMNVS
jgi:hypothetical protein